jgi:hypothetical protein
MLGADRLAKIHCDQAIDGKPSRPGARRPDDRDDPDSGGVEARRYGRADQSSRANQENLHSRSLPQLDAIAWLATAFAFGLRLPVTHSAGQWPDFPSFGFANAFNAACSNNADADSSPRLRYGLARAARPPRRQLARAMAGND